MTPAAVLVALSLAQPSSAPSSQFMPTSTLAETTAPNATENVRGPERTQAIELGVPIVHSLALMTVMRGVETVLWPDPFARTEHFAAHYGEAFTKPPLFDTSKPAFQWDGDPWTINVLGHGLFGSELYMRARTCHLPWYGALALAAAASTLWEYGFEANGVRPSAFDLVYTPLMGGLLGEGRYAIWRAAEGIEWPLWRNGVRAAVDPFGEIERAVGTRC